MEETIKYLKNILKKDNTIIISCSGGPDSMCLFSLLLSLKENYNLNIICAHVNHNIRPESKEEEEYVRNYCQKNNIKFELLSIKEYKKQNFHDDARVQRYKFLDELAKKYSSSFVMTAHHGDDLMETILMRLERGSNLTGYAGFKQIMKHNDYYLVRPLIFYSKEKIKEYVDNNNIKYYIDQTNSSNEYTRNRYRNNILPLLKKENKNIHQKYLKFSQELYEYDNFIKNTIINQKLINQNQIIINKFNLETDFIKRKTLEYYISLIQQKNEFYIKDNNILEIIKLINSKKINGIIKLPNEFIGVKSYNKFYIIKYPLEKEFEIEFNNCFQNNNWDIKTIVTSEEDDKYIFRFLKSELKLPIKIRSIQKNDQIELKNFKGHKKVSEIFNENKIDLIERLTWPIIVDSKNTILGVVCLKKSKFAKDKTQKYDIIIKCKERLDKYE